MRKQNIKPTNGKGEPHGLWVWYYANDELNARLRFVNGKRHGIEEKYTLNNKIYYKTYYNNEIFRYCEWYDANEIKFHI